MKKRDLKKMALMGLTSGLLVTSQGESTTVDTTLIDVNYLLAASNNSCSANKNGCSANKNVWPSALKNSRSGLLAENDDQTQNKSPYQTPAAASTDNKGKSDNSSQNANDGNLGYHLMTEDELMLELNDQGIKMFKSLSKEGKELALKVVSMRCNGTNECKGLNACKTEKNECAGRGSCKGQGKCAFSDKNLAVKVVYDKLKAKRSGLLHQ